MYLKDNIWMAAIGLIAVVHGAKHYIDTGRLDLMSVVFALLSVLYFVALVTKKETE